MAGLTDKSFIQLEQEIHQLEEKASRQQSSAASYEQALRQSQNLLAEAERNRSLQQAHLRQLQSDIRLKRDSARNAREAAASRKLELQRRLAMEAEEKARLRERRCELLQLQDIDICVLIEKAQRDH